MQDNFYTKYGKRIFDFVVTSIGLLCLLPFFCIIGGLIKLQDKGPIFFKQKRVGKNFKPFYIYKFRTMIVNAEKLGPLVTKGEDPRITPIGKFLRKFKIDELPQLINVLKGEMSLVGPRPEVPKYVEIFKKDYENILKVKPGITDYASIYFRDEEEVLKNYPNPEEGYIKEVLPQKIKFYYKYLNEISFLTDLKLIFLTFWKIIKH
ncbi:MAG: sugar transferase [Thermodesulfobacteria bacterium]|nr:sugar transferase [Thermodesulfobacteriota bacterium]